MTRPTQKTNFFKRFFNGAYGDFRTEEACECVSTQGLSAKKITLAEFRLQPIKTQLCIITCVILSLALAAGVITYGVSHPSLLVLIITIPVAVVLGLLGLLLSAMWVGGHRSYHRYVCFELNCNECNHTYFRTYDCLTLQKRTRCGQYKSKTCREVKTPRSIDIPYELVEEKYDEMRDGLDKNPFGYNCIDWANEFHAKFV